MPQSNGWFFAVFTFSRRSCSTLATLGFGVEVRSGSCRRVRSARNDEDARDRDAGVDLVARCESGPPLYAVPHAAHRLRGLQPVFVLAGVFEGLIESRFALGGRHGAGRPARGVRSLQRR